MSAVCTSGLRDADVELWRAESTKPGSPASVNAFERGMGGLDHCKVLSSPAASENFVRVDVAATGCSFVDSVAPCASPSY